MKIRAILAAGLVLAVATSATNAAPIQIQDYEAPGNLDEPFHLHPGFSGSTLGEAAVGNANVLDNTTGALGTAQSARLTIVDDPAVAGAHGTEWSVRLVPNSAANESAANPIFNGDGYVGFYLKADPLASGTVRVAPLLEPAPAGGSTFESAGGVLKTLIADGQWHRYQWNMDDPNDFPNSFESFFGGTHGPHPVFAQVHFESIAIIGSGGVPTNVVINIDQIGYNNEGQLIPEPATFALAGIAVMGLFVARRRTR